MRMDGEITKEIFLEKKTSVEEKIYKLEQRLANQVLHNHSNNVNIVNKLKALRKAMENEFDFLGQEIPEEMIEAFVDSVIVYKDHFEWNLKLTEKPICCKVDGSKRRNEVLLVEKPLVVGCNTSCFE